MAQPTAPPPSQTTAPPLPWAHPNDAAAKDPADAGEARAPPPAARPPSLTAAPAPRASAADDDPEALRARLADLDRQANHAKVRYGLGQLSAHGYRQVLSKLDAARARIEEALLGDLEV